MQKCSEYLLSDTGTPVANAQITVYYFGTSTLAPLFATANGVAISNPIASLSTGYFEFYAANGKYTLSIVATGYANRTITLEILNDVPAPLQASWELIGDTAVTTEPSRFGGTALTLSGNGYVRATSNAMADGYYNFNKNYWAISVQIRPNNIIGTQTIWNRNTLSGAKVALELHNGSPTLLLKDTLGEVTNIYPAYADALLFSQVSSLLHFDGANGSSIVDSGPQALPWTTVGNSTISTTAPVYGTGSLRLGGAGYARPTDMAAADQYFDFGTGDFAFEQWVTLDSATGVQTVVARANATGLAMALRVNEGVAEIYLRSAAGVVSTFALADVYFDNVTLLLQPTESSWASGLIDKSLYQHVIASTTGVTYVAQGGPFDNPYLHFAGISSGSRIQYAAAPEFDADVNDIAYECWIRPAEIPASEIRAGFIIARQNPGSYLSYVSITYRHDRKIDAFFSNGDYYYPCISLSEIPLNAWTYVAFKKVGNTQTLYINGTAESSTSITDGPELPENNSSFYVGFNPHYGNDFAFVGDICDLRITKNANRTIALPTEPFPSNIYIPAFTPTYLKFNRTSGVFALQVGNKVVVSQAADIDLSFDATAPYTLGALLQGGAASDYLTGYIDDHRATKGNSRPGPGPIAAFPGNIFMPTLEWTQLVAKRSDNDITLEIDGVAIANAAITGDFDFDATDLLTIGAQLENNVANQFFIGNVDEFCSTLIPTDGTQENPWSNANGTVPYWSYKP